MEAPELTCPASPARDQPAPASGPPGAPGGQASPHLTLGPVLLPPEQGRAPTVFLKALPIPLYHTVPPGGLQPRAPLVTGSLDGGGGVPFLLSPLLQPEGPGPTPIGKPATPTLTVNIVGTLPVLSPCPGPALGGPGKARHAGKYLCPHCGRDCLKPSVLEKHIRSHTGERPFPCATCGIAFKTQSNLYKHRRTQTHFNNARLSSESEGAGGSLLEEGDKAGETSRAASKGDGWSQGGTGGAPPERPLSPGAQGAGHCSVPPTHLSPVSKNLDPKLEAVCCPGQTPADGEARMASTGLPAADSQPRRPPQEPRGPPAGRACSLPQPQAPSSEKPGDTKASEGRLRKCESTDSGYLSRSDSVEQPLPPGSPLRSLSEHSAESEGEGATGPRGTRAERGGRGPSLELEKRQLEERIARLISHNQAVVDDPQLDHVRPRKTVLSKQGSIDLPMPYTYKDSFHFEIRALEPGRRRPGALGPARSTCTPLDKARPLFFHSVPTQLSTTSECVAVTRSNSLPFVEGTRTWKEPPDPQDSGSWRQKPLSPRPAPARMADVPGGHPRALVRQAAVEDLPGPPTRDTMTPTEDPDGKRVVAGDDGAASKGRGAGRKRGQRRLQMFSQEKWQVYGRETFQRLYQKMRASRQGGRRAREGGVGCGVEQDLPPKGGAAGGGEGAALSQDSQTLICGDSSVGAQPGPLESPPATEVFLVTESPERRETAARAGGTEQPRESRSVLPPTCTCREPPSSGSKSPVLPARGRLEMGCPLPPALGPLKGGDLEAPRLPDPKLEGGAQGGGDTEEQALLIPRDPGSSPGEPQTVEPWLPSERKKLRVEGPTSPEQRGTLGAGGQALGPPGQATPLPPWKQDSDPGDKPGELHRGSECPVRGGARASGARGASFSASSVALTPGLRDKEPGLGPEATFPGIPSPLAPQPQAPDTPAALTDTTFPPKYLLRLPQGESPSPPPGAQGRLCRTWGPEDLVSSLGSEPGTLLSPRPAAGLAPGRADSFEEDPGLWGCRKGALGEEEGGLDPGTPQSGEPAGWSAGALKETASVLPTWACDSWRSETHAPGRLCSRSSGTRAQASPSILDPRPLNRDVAKPPENVPEDPPPGPPAGQHPYCSLRASSAFSSTLLPPGRPGVASGTPSGSPGGCGPQGPFPSLKAEPQLTWCCLSRSLPLPVEQKGKAASVCWALHRPGRGSLAQGADTRLASKAAWGRWTRTSPAEGGETRPWKLSYLTAPGVTSRDPGTEPAWKKGPPRRRAKLSRASSKQKTLRRYRGSFLQGRVQLRARRLRKPLWVLRKDCHPPPLEGLDPRRTLGQAASETAELSLLEEPSRASSGSPLGGGKGEKEEQDRGPTAGGGLPSASPTHRDPLAVQDGILSAGEPGDCCPRDTLVSSGLSLPPDSYIQVARNGLPSYGTGLDVRFLETQQPSPQEQVPADPKLCVVSDARDPSSFEPKGNSLRRDVATPVVGICTSLGARGGHTTMGSHRAETQEQDRAAGETVTCGSSPDKKAAAQGTSPSLLPGKPSPGPRLSGLVPARTPGKTHPEISASGPGSRREEERPKVPSPSGGHPGCGEMLAPGPPPGKNSGTCQESGLVALKGCVVPSKPEPSTEVPQAPSKTIKKRSLEGMRKQSRVEFSDTSSDDEDRLVIEI